MDVCPTDVILAPAGRIWELVTAPQKLAQWTETTLVEGPARAIKGGDRLVLGAGIFRITFDVLDIDPPTRLTVDVGLPLGVINHEQIQVAAIDAHSTRVTFN
jgi:uncharacterized protein YndB with AHSA1/START domain